MYRCNILSACIGDLLPLTSKDGVRSVLIFNGVVGTESEWWIYDVLGSCGCAVSP